MTRKLLKYEGIYAGGSAGAAICGAIKYANTLKEPKKILVLLHDSGNRYSSKIYNDDWMSDNGYLDSSFNVSISEVLEQLGKIGQKIHSLPDTATIGDAVDLMDKEGISQIPVFQGDKIKGMVTEKNLLRPYFLGKIHKSDSISLAFSNNYQMIDCHELLSRVADSLLQKEVAFVTQDGVIKNILTEIDILHYMNAKEKN